MSNVIRIKRSSVTIMPETLQAGELAYGANGDLWIGTASGIQKIGGTDVVTRPEFDYLTNSFAAQLSEAVSNLITADDSIQTALTNALASETSFRTAADDALTASIAALQSAVDSRFGEVTGYIDAVVGNVNAVVTDLNKTNDLIYTIRGELLTATDVALTNAKAYTDQKVADLVGQSPALLDTLQEIGQALGQDPNLSTTLLTAISNEETARAAGDAAINARIDDEHQMLWNTMTRMGDAENAMLIEQSARADADTAINARIDSLTTSLTDVVIDGGEF